MKRSGVPPAETPGVLVTAYLTARRQSAKLNRRRTSPDKSLQPRLLPPGNGVVVHQLVRTTIRHNSARSARNPPPSNKKLMHAIMSIMWHLCFKVLNVWYQGADGPEAGLLLSRGGEGGRGFWTQNLVYQKWPDQIFPIVNFVFSHYGHFGLGRGGGGFGGGPPPPPWVLIILKKPCPEVQQHIS